MRRGVLAFVVAFVFGLSGIATAAVFSGPGTPPAGPSARGDMAEANEQDTGIHGGPIARFQRAGSCDLTAVSSLPGNWTHGDYVTAVAANGSSAEVTQAAHSDCGKPMVSVGHGGGPPAHALEHMLSGQAHGGGPEDEASETSGS